MDLRLRLVNFVVVSGTLGCLQVGGLCFYLLLVTDFSVSQVLRISFGFLGLGGFVVQDLLWLVFCLCVLCEFDVYWCVG